MWRNGLPLCVHLESQRALENVPTMVHPVHPSYHYRRNQGFVRSMVLVELEPLVTSDIVGTAWMPWYNFLSFLGHDMSPLGPVLWRVQVHTRPYKTIQLQLGRIRKPYTDR